MYKEDEEVSIEDIATEIAQNLISGKPIDSHKVNLLRKNVDWYKKTHTYADEYVITNSIIVVLMDNRFNYLDRPVLEVLSNNGRKYSYTL